MSDASFYLDVIKAHWFWNKLPFYSFEGSRLNITLIRLYTGVNSDLFKYYGTLRGRHSIKQRCDLEKTPKVLYFRLKLCLIIAGRMDFGFVLLCITTSAKSCSVVGINRICI